MKLKDTNLTAEELKSIATILSQSGRRGCTSMTRRVMLTWISTAA